MSFPIQRVPYGLQNVLSLAGAGTPQELGDTVTPTFDLLQAYALNQRQSLVASSGAVAALGTVDIAPTTVWCVLFQVHVTVTKQAGMTDVGAAVQIARGGGLGHFYAYGEPRVPGVAGNRLVVPYVAPYPLLLPPGTIISAFLATLVGVANAAVSVQADVGVLG